MASILVVDDSTISRNALKTILAAGGHQVVGEASDGEDAVSKYLELKPDIVTLDITMPKLNGIECLKRIMSKDPDAKVVMITALGQGSKVLEALENGARHYLAKPFEADRVLEAVGEVAAA